MGVLSSKNDNSTFRVKFGHRGPYSAFWACFGLSVRGRFRLLNVEKKRRRPRPRVSPTNQYELSFVPPGTPPGGCRFGPALQARVARVSVTACCSRGRTRASSGAQEPPKARPSSSEAYFEFEFFNITSGHRSRHAARAQPRPQSQRDDDRCRRVQA